MALFVHLDAMHNGIKHTRAWQFRGEAVFQSYANCSQSIINPPSIHTHSTFLSKPITLTY